MHIEISYLTKSAVNRNFFPIRQRFAREPLVKFRMNSDFFSLLKMNVKDIDDLNICRGTYFDNVHMFDEIGASRSMRLIPLHLVTDEHMFIYTAL